MGTVSRRRSRRTLARRPSGAAQRRAARDRGTPELQRHRAEALRRSARLTRAKPDDPAGAAEPGAAGPDAPPGRAVDAALAESALGRLQAAGRLDALQVAAGLRYFVLYRIWLGGWSVRAAPLGDLIPAWDNSDPLDTAGVERRFKQADDHLRGLGAAVRRQTRATVLGDADPAGAHAAALVAVGLTGLARLWRLRAEPVRRPAR